MSDSQTSENNLLVLGRLGKVHGIKGWLKLSSYTAPAESILDYSPLQAKIGQGWKNLEIDQSRHQANGLVVHFKGFDNPEDARNLTGLELSVDREELPELKAGEFYWYQLQGMDVVNRQGEHYGKVAHMLETGANDVLVVKPDKDSDVSIDERERLIPFLVDSVIEEVNLASGVITVNWDADYLA